MEGREEGGEGVDMHPHVKYAFSVGGREALDILNFLPSSQNPARLITFPFLSLSLVSPDRADDDRQLHGRRIGCVARLAEILNF